MDSLKGKVALITGAIYFALSQSEGVALNEITVRPAWQER